METPSPNKHKTLNLCCLNVGPPSSTLSQHLNNRGSTHHVCWAGFVHIRPAPMAHSIRSWLETQRSWARIPAGSDVCHIQCSKLFKCLECAVLSMVLCTIKNPWSHWIGVGYSPDFGLPSVAILPGLCRKRRKAIFTHSFTHISNVHIPGLIYISHSQCYQAIVVCHTCGILLWPNYIRDTCPELPVLCWSGFLAQLVE